MTKNATEKMKSRPAEEQMEFDEVKKTQMFVFQFVCHETGKRSEPFTGTWAELDKILKLRKEGEKPHEQDYILLVAVLNEEETHIPGTPLITVKTYEQMVAFKEDQ